MSFNISEVADYLGIEKLQDTGGDSIPICCPYCGDRRGKNTICIRKDGKEKNVFQCFSCGRHGNMLDLYLDQKAGYVGVDRYKRAYADLRDALEKGHRDHTTKKRVEETDRKTEKTKAPVNVLDHTYRSLLCHLTLQTIDRLDLQRRMLTDAEIEAGLFRSVPSDPVGICRILKREGCMLENVPGFYKNAAGNWQLNVWAEGYFCPVLQDGYLVGMQIRLRNPKKQKYIWLSSSGKRAGISSGAPVCFYGDPDAESVIITEGILKAYVTYCLLSDIGVSVIGVPGVNVLGGLKELLKQHHHKIAYEAYDMDKYMPVACMRDYEAKKCAACIQSGGREAYCPDGSCRYKERKRQMIQEAQDSLQKVITKAGLIGRFYHWDRDPVSGLWLGNKKGIDDYCSMRRGGMSHAGAGYPGSARTGAL